MANINASFKQQVLRILSNFKKVHELKDEESTVLFTVFQHSMIYTPFAFIVMDNYFKPTIQSARSIVCLFRLFDYIEVHFSILGLRGNKLDMKAVHKFHSLLEQPQNFPTLVWLDFRNNIGINTIPGELVQLFMQRRTNHRGSKETADEKSAISIQDAINGKVV